VEAVGKVSGGGVYLSPDVSEELATRAATGTPSPLSVLTHREFEIFRLTAEGLDHAAIGRALNLSQKTVSNHLSAVRAKLDVSSVAELVRLAIRYGVASA
jgi:DNA-binding NarL/FixJ family response regulator